MPVSAGINEVAAVCPRCGTPFTYTVPEDAETVERQPLRRESSEIGVEKQSFSTPKAVLSDSESSPFQSGKHSNPTTVGQQPWQERLREGIQKQSNVPDSERRRILDSILLERTIRPQQPQKRKGFNFTGCGCLMFIILCLVLYSAYIYVSSNSYTADDMSDDISMVEQEVASGKKIDEHEKETPPEWLQGRWEVDTRTGKIVIFIKDEKISELSGNDVDGFEASHGTFYYSKGILYCKFEDADMEELRRIDVKRKRIDAGDGLWMKKTQ